MPIYSYNSKTMSEKLKEMPIKILLRIKLYGFLILLLIIFILAACSNLHNEDSAGKTEEKSEIIQTSESIAYKGEIEEVPAETTAIEQKEVYPYERFEEFSVKAKAGDDFIALKDWDDKVDLHSLLGETINEKTEILGDSADTFSGSFVKTMQYEGLEIILFSPKDNGSSFWIMEIIVTGEEYSTYEGIEIGGSLELLKEIYPSLYMLEDGRTDDNNCAYEIADMEEYNYLRFEVSDGIITEIRIYHDIP